MTHPTASERARKVLDAVMSDHQFDGYLPSNDDFIDALHDAGLVIVDATWHEAAGICMELYDFEQEKAP